MALSTSYPVNLTAIITELGLSPPQGIIACNAAHNVCGENATYWVNGNSLSHWRGYTHSGLGATGTITPTSTTIGQPAGTLGLTITVTAGAAWNITDDAAWASVAPSSGVGTGSGQSVTLTYSANPDPGTRNVRVTLRQTCDAAALDFEIYTQSGTA